MDRRTFLSSCGVAASIAVAGCGGANTDPESGDDPGANSEPTPTPEPTPEPTLTDQSITTEQTSCQSTDGEASARFDAETLAVDIEGTITAPNPCHDATLADATYDDEAETLTVTVATEARDEICVDCVGQVEYAATVSFEGALPGRVAVEHGTEEPRTVTEQDR